MKNLREYQRPSTVDEALSLLARKSPRSRPMAGGTDLIADAPQDIAAVVDLQNLPLAYIESEDNGLRLGALTRLATIAETPVIREFAGGVLADAARLSATSLLRNQSTLVGTLLSHIENGELPPALLVLNSELLIRRIDGLITLPLSRFYEDLNRYSEAAIITEVRVPKPPDNSVVRRHRVARTRTDQAILTVCALTRMANGRIAEARVAGAGLGPLPVRLTDVETALLGLPAAAAPVEAAAIEGIRSLSLPNDIMASAEYRRTVLTVLIRRAVTGI